LRGSIIKKVLNITIGIFTGGGITWLLFKDSSIGFNSLGALARYDLLLNVILLKLIVIMLLSYRWKMVLRYNEINQCFFDSIKFILIGHSLMMVIPGVAAQDLAKIAGTIHTSKSSKQHIKILSLAVLDRLLGVVALFLSSIFLILVYFIYEYIALEVSQLNKLLAVVLFACFLSLSILAVLYFILSKTNNLFFHFKKINTFLLKVSKIITYLNMIKIKKIIIGVSMLAHIINALIVVIVVKEFNSEIHVLINIIFGLISNFGNFFPLTPGGLGVTESVFMYLYSYVDYNNGVVIGVSYRLLSYTSFIVLTFIILVASYFKRA
jgi:uncharacterized protein (TIRG00374 family)